MDRANKPPFCVLSFSWRIQLARSEVVLGVLDSCVFEGACIYRGKFAETLVRSSFTCSNFSLIFWWGGGGGREEAEKPEWSSGSCAIPSVSE